MSFTQVLLSGVIDVQPGVPAGGAVVTAQLSSAITDGTTIIYPFSTSATCDSGGNLPTTGGATLTLPANNDPSTIPIGTFYTIVVIYQNQILNTFNISIPYSAGPTVELNSLTKIPAPDQPLTPQITSLNGLNGIVQLVAGSGIVISVSGNTITIST
jgi:hypothetical protein